MVNIFTHGARDELLPLLEQMSDLTELYAAASATHA